MVKWRHILSWDLQPNIRDNATFYTSGDGGVTLKGDRFLIELDWLGEGISGDYDETDPDDRRLMRYTVHERFEVSMTADAEYTWAQLEDSSHCSAVVSVDDPLSRKKKFLLHLYNIALDHGDTYDWGQMTWWNG